jgi:hypothetical protein
MTGFHQSERWGVCWRSDNQLDGRTRHLIWNGVGPHLFRTRREALAYIRAHYGYLARHPDLRREPHGWKMPVPVRVIVTLDFVEPK